MNMLSCPSHTICCLRMYPGVRSTLSRCCSVPLTKHKCRKCFEHRYNIPISTNKCSIRNRSAAYLCQQMYPSFGALQCVLALAKPTQSTIIPLRNVPCPSKRRRVIFQRSNRRIWLKKIIIYLLEKQNVQCYCHRAPSQHGHAS